MLSNERGIIDDTCTTASMKLSPVEKAILAAQEQIDESVKKAASKSKSESTNSRKVTSLEPKSQQSTSSSTSPPSSSTQAMDQGLQLDVNANVNDNVNVNPDQEFDLSFYEMQWKKKQNPPLPISEWSKAFPDLYLLNEERKGNANANANENENSMTIATSKCSSDEVEQSKSASSKDVQNMKKMTEVRSKLKERIREQVMFELNRIECAKTPLTGIRKQS